MGRKKAIEESKDNPLELLPESRTRIHQLPDKSAKKPVNVSNEMDSSSATPTVEPGKEPVLIHSINYLITEVFCSHQQQSAFEEMKGDSVLAKSLNYLFIDAADASC